MAARTMKTPDTSGYEAAETRVWNDPRLFEHREFILADWPEGEAHWQWVVTAEIGEILDWVSAGK